MNMFMDEVADAAGIGGRGFSALPGALVRPWGTNMGEVARWRRRRRRRPQLLHAPRLPCLVVGHEHR
jgi:hypothetical protein